MLIGWDRGHFFLNQEGTFGNQEGMITWCWLAERACIKLVSCFKRSLKRNFRNASLLSLILTRSFHLNVKENQHATKCSLLVEKQKDFSEQNCIHSQPENSFEWGRLVLNEALDRTSRLRDSGNFVKTLKILVKLILNCPRAHAITYTNRFRCRKKVWILSPASG